MPASTGSGPAPGELSGNPAPGAPAPVAPPLGPPRGPAGAGGSAGVSRFRPTALVVALAVLLVGAAAGAGMFALEQASITWRPHATKTTAGWRIAGPHGLVIRDASLSGDHLAWVSGPYTVVFDLTRGRSRLLGIARDSTAAAAPAVSEQYAAWLEETGGAGSPSIWSYRFSTSARRRLASTPGVVWAPALSGATLVWAGRAGDSGAGTPLSTAITTRDLSRGGDRVVAQGPSVDGPVLMDGMRIGWFVSGRPPHYDVRDLAGGQLWSVDLAMLASGAWADLMGIDLSGTTLVWRLQAADGTGEIFAADLIGGTTQPVASGPGLSGGSIDGDVVVWAQPAVGGTSIMCRRLSGGSPFVVATVATGRVTDVLVSGDTVAWIDESGPSGFNGIETARLAQ